MNKFQRECEKAIASISKEDVSKFNTAINHECRIKVINKYANSLSVKLVEPRKDIEVAEKEKVKGNCFFAKKDYKSAIKSYNAGIVSCPQNDDSSKELLAILVANRSATFFEMQEYRKVLNDIDYILEIDRYPKHLLYKIWLRKAKCYDALQNKKSANEVYQQALDCLKYSKLDSEKISLKIKEIQKSRTESEYKLIPKEIVAVCDEPFFPNETYVAAYNGICFDQDDIQGKFARAAKDIPSGQIIIEENPHGSVLSPENYLTNCQHCLISTDQIYACPNCPSVIFCSSNCERLANETYHKYECAFQNTLIQSGASINCLLAVRIITQKSLKFFTETRLKLKKFLTDNCVETFLVDPYKSENYETAFFLCRNESSRTKKELLHYTIMSIYLLKLLHSSDFFGEIIENTDALSEDDTFIVSLMIRHLELLQFNCHEIAELRNTIGGEDGVGNSYELQCIGAGLYPTAALFNHSCDPSIIRYNSKNKLIVRTIKPIKKGDIIYENYGPIYTTMKREFRQQFLRKRYWFDCVCLPCVEYWPRLDEMNEQDMRIECKSCFNVIVMNKVTIEPFLVCDWCGKRENLFPILKNLMVLEEILPNAEEFYLNGQFREAISLFLQALKILYDNLKPPCPDMIKIQQRLRTCFVHYGNRMVGYEVKQ
ncbi:SET and MYND domain-containing protein 4-like [Coccinella septempunctata]|uniref:SET and MYND domain-containing protein 4-like n=1 Tax=Coccinella septempunctata TaxID=41139 RepID=UPI001D08E2C2|nr:SET and MYND domain-containing protein 4-like [Coccinella septempunctata]